jgi:methylglutaconyl-CoA hydratase
MQTPESPILRIEEIGSVAAITLNRPDVHNAFDATMISSLAIAFEIVSHREDLRAIVLRGNGPSFSAGADTRWMRASLEWSHEENVADATALSNLFEAIATCPLPVIGVVHGAALGGGAGLVACCDLVIAAEDTRFGFTEVRLGLVPATIAPFVVAKIGQSQARALFITGERFDTARALAIGLIHRVVPEEELDAALAETLGHIRASGPLAMRVAKDLARRAGTLEHEAARQWTIETIADVRTGPEAQEGLLAFLEKRRATWAEDA